MAKRFTDTSKWNKPFLRNIKAEYKILWIYILDECDHAGVWQVDMEVAQLKTGCKFKKSEAEKIFSEKIIVFSKGEKWLIVDFIDFQYGELNPANRVHLSVIQILSKENLIDSDYKIKPLISPLQGVKDKDKDKDMDKEKDKDELGGEKIEFPEGELTEFERTFLEFEKMRTRIKKPLTPYAKELILKELQKLSQDEQTQIEILNQSIRNSYQGVFPLKNDGFQKNTTSTPSLSSFDQKQKACDEVMEYFKNELDATRG